MPRRTWVDDDFQAFRANFLSSLAPSVPLQENLRAVMVPALAKLRRYAKAAVALHFFVNPMYKEVHVVMCGASERTNDVVRQERARRSEARNLIPAKELPCYFEHRLETMEATAKLFRNQEEEYTVALTKELLRVTQNLARDRADEFNGQQPRAGDLLIVLPLRSKGSPQLGYFVLWSPEAKLKETADSVRDREIRCTFQSRLRQVLVRIFANYYRMGPSTYLPSYYRPGRKKVTLMWAHIRDFDRIWANIELHGGLVAEDKEKCRLKLLGEFGQIAAQSVEKLCE